MPDQVKRTKSVKVGFFLAKQRLRKEFSWPDELYPFEEVGNKVRSRLNTDNRYVQLGDQVLMGDSESHPSHRHFVLCRVRRDALPTLEENGEISPLSLTDNHNLAEPAHLVFFENSNVVGKIINRDGPGLIKCAQYLEEVGGTSLHLAPILRPDVLEHLATGGVITRAVMRISVAGLSELTEAAPSLRDAADALLQITTFDTLELTLTPNSSNRNTFDREIRRVIDRIMRRHIKPLEKLEVFIQGDDDAPTQIIDILADRLAVTVPAELSTNSRHVDKEAARLAIFQSYESLREQINDSLSQAED